VSEREPWRNPRPAPNLAEIRANTPPPRALALLWAWWPAILWAGVIFTMSTDTFSAQHTANFFESIFHWLFPGLTADQLEIINHIVRKCAHFTEYFVFFLVLYRAVRAGRAGWRWTWAIIAWLIAALYSASDEFHQIFVPSRGPSPYDSLLDSTGALVALLVLWLWFRRRPAIPPPAVHADSAS
jgi:VanZ family protein